MPPGPASASASETLNAWPAGKRPPGSGSMNSALGSRSDELCPYKLDPSPYRRAHQVTIGLCVQRLDTMAQMDGVALSVDGRPAPRSMVSLAGMAASLMRRPRFQLRREHCGNRINDDSPRPYDGAYPHARRHTRTSTSTLLKTEISVPCITDCD